MTKNHFEIEVEELDETTCWRLLSQEGFGRIGFVSDDQVMVLPVNVAVVEGTVVFRTADDSMLAAAGAGSVVCCEADHTDRVAESGWSVLVNGQMWDVTDQPESAGWSDLMVRPWVPGSRDRWMSIKPTQVTGRAISRRRVIPPSPPLR